MKKASGSIPPNALKSPISSDHAFISTFEPRRALHQRKTLLPADFADERRFLIRLPFLAAHVRLIMLICLRFLL
jgi:hypothetical protein